MGSITGSASIFFVPTEQRRPSVTFMAGFQLDLSAVAPIAAVGPSPDPEHVGGPRLQPLHRHHVGAGLQNGVVLLPLILKRRRQPGGLMPTM